MDTETYLPWTWAFIVWDLGQVICIWSTHLPWIWAFIVWDLGRVICIWPTHLKACLFIPLHRASLSIQITCSLEHKHTGSASKENKYRRTDKHTYKHRDTWSASSTVEGADTKKNHSLPKKLTDKSRQSPTTKSSSAFARNLQNPISLTVSQNLKSESHLSYRFSKFEIWNLPNPIWNRF